MPDRDVMELRLERIEAVVHAFALLATGRGEQVRLAPGHDAFGAVEELLNLVCDEYTAMHRRRLAVTEAAERLAEMAGHDLRSPVAAAILTFERLRGSLALREPEAARTFERLGRALERIREAAATLVEYSQAELSRGVVVMRQRTDLAKPLSAAMAQLRGMYEGCDVALQLVGDLEGEFDAGLVRRIVELIVSDAFRRNPGVRRVAVRAVGETDRVTLEIHEDPAGDGNALRAALGAPVPDGAASGSTVLIALGISLYLARKLVVAHGGDIEVCPVPPEGGGCLRVGLPRSAPAQKPRPLPRGTPSRRTFPR